MRCIAIVLAGGTGVRMDSEIPKPFININDKPILMYTLDAFEKHPQVDAIEVVSIQGWEEVVKAYSKQHNISKINWVTTGGASAQESIYNGIMNIKDQVEDDDIIIIHDGIRPLVEQAVLTDAIKVAKEMGNAISSMPYNEQIFVIDSDNKSKTRKYIPRETIRRVSTPQAYNARTIIDAYEEAKEKNIGFHTSSYADTLMTDLGKKLYFSIGSDKNIKIVTQDDLGLFKAYLKREEDLWLK